MRIDFNLEQHKVQLKYGHLKMGQTNSFGHSIDATNLYLTKDGHPWLPVMGEFQYSRYDADQWEKELLKMKAGGIQIIASYFIWLHHEEEENRFCFTGDRDVRRFAQLCQKHGLYLLARIGPWVHGEVRNGGFPDWVLSYKTRTNDEKYLDVVQRLYRQYSQQLRGLLFVDGGPVIGIQLENELVDRPEHLKKLKEIAIEEGLTVPLYTVTAWAVSGIGKFPEYEMLPVFGAYPEAPWRQNIDPFERKPHYIFAPGRNDITIGSDLLKKGNTVEENEAFLDDYPFAYCEMGPGVQSTYHRRPVIEPEDLYSILLVTLAKGNNLPGYYVFHGGRNPSGKLGMYQESKDTGYPNDLPVISYDFQAPIGEYGFIKPSYHYYRLIHLFLRCYGEDVAQMQAFYPDTKPKSRKDTEAPRCAIRANNEGYGYIFLNTKQRNERLEPIRSLQLKLKGCDMPLPLHPLDIPSATSCFFPLNSPVVGSCIRYALAQPITKISYGNSEYHFFTAVDGVPVEFLLDGQYTDLKTKGTIHKTPWGIQILNIAPGMEPVIEYNSAGKRIYFVVLKFLDALRLYQVSHGNQKYVVLSDLPIYTDEEGITVYGEPDDMIAGIYSFPKLPILSESVCKNGLFTEHRIEFAPCKISFEMEECTENIITSDNPYVRYLFEPDLNRTKEYRLKMICNEVGDMEDVRILLDGEFDVMQIYEGQQLTSDCFNLGNLVEIGQKRHEKALGSEEGLRIKIAPYSEGKQVFLERKIDREKLELALYEAKVQYKKKLLWKEQ